MIGRAAILLGAAYMTYVMARRGLRALQGAGSGDRGRPRPIEAARPCPECGVYVVGTHPSPCTRPDCFYGRS